MFATIREDLLHKIEWYGLRKNWRSLVLVCFSDGSTAQLLYRAMRFCQTHHLKVFAAIVYRLNAAVGHVVIGRGAQVGPGFIILHTFGIVIHSGVRAGRNLVLHQGVTIGAEKNLSPVLGDNVFIGAGAKVIGGVRIGSDVKIGANAVVTKDLPDGATAVGIPARVVKVYGARITTGGAPEYPLPGMEELVEHHS
jgi:serine O-acetyltransferase